MTSPGMRRLLSVILCTAAAFTRTVSDTLWDLSERLNVTA